MPATADRNTLERAGRDFSYPVAAAAKIYAGTIVVLAAGVAAAASAAVGLVAVGRCKETVDNTTGADGDLSVSVERGCFRFDNSASADEITLADVGSPCYAVDDSTVAKTDGSGARSVAGTVRDVDAGGVWVEF